MESVAQKMVCCNLGILHNGEDITEAAINAFELKFKEQLSVEVISAMRQIFKLDDANVVDVKEAIITHGGAADLDHEEGAMRTHA